MARPEQPDERRIAAHDLCEVQEAFRMGRYDVTNRVRRHLRRKHRTFRDLESCIAKLEQSDFHKSQRHLAKPDVWLER